MRRRCSSNEIWIGCTWLAAWAAGCADVNLNNVPSDERDGATEAPSASGPEAEESAALAPDSTAALDALAWPERLELERATAERDPRYRPVLEEGIARLAQPAGPSASIDARGARIGLGGSQVAVRLAGIGRGAHRVQLGASPPSVQGAEVQRQLGPGIVEWWRALPSGLEHGVTLEERPAGQGALVLDVAIEGVQTRERSERAVELVDASGRRVGRYAELMVLDASGVQVPARMAVASGGVRIEIDDGDARYPLVVDPLVTSEEAKLLPSGSPDQFGWSVALSADGRRALVGAPSDRTAENKATGSVRVFVRTGTTWTEEATLLDADGADLDEFGYSVALSADGSRALVGVRRDDTVGGEESGSARVFVRSGTTWTEEATLLASDDDGETPFRRFGTSVALSADGSVALVGMPHDNTAAGTTAGSARVFVRDGTTWTEEAKLLASDGAAGDQFGTSVALSADGSVALVGAPWDDTAAGSDKGSARVFVRDGTTWTEEAKLLASDAEGQRRPEFGASVALSADGSLALVGMPGDDRRYTDGGSARVFVRDGTTWTEEATLHASDDLWGDWFGTWVALSADGRRALVGARLDDTAAGENAGSARIFVRDGATWTEEATLLASDGAGGDFFGHSVALSADGRRALVGASKGSAHVFTLALTPNGTPCTSDEECASDFCTDGVCCESACGHGALDCQACSVAAGGSADGTCTPLTEELAATVTCRPAAGLCDIDEVCTPTSTECPPDEFVPEMTVCRPVAGDCDLAETCTGTSPDCPPDAFAPPTMVCRPAVSECDYPDMCTGDSVGCPEDSAMPAGTPCGAAPEGACDAQDVCSGVIGATATCEPRVAAAGTPCGEASCTDGQEQVSTCDGHGKECPAPVVRDCGPYACGASACLASCNGDGDCASGYTCQQDACVFASPDAGVRDAGVAPGGGGGGCSAAGSSSSRAPLALAMLAMTLIAVRRRAGRSRAAQLDQR